MTRKQEIIDLIHELKPEALLLGFDWPLQDINEADEQILEEFYVDLAEYINENSGF